VRLYFDPKSVLLAWSLLIRSAPRYKTLATYQYDIIDVTAQSLSVIALSVYDEIVAAFNRSDLASFQSSATKFSALIQDMDEITASNENFLLGKWTSSARAWAVTSQERIQYENNARLQITSWINPAAAKNINQYANKLWAGLIYDFYLPRWNLFFDIAIAALKEKKPIDEAKYREKIIALEDTWVYGMKTYPNVPVGDTVQIATNLFHKYATNV
jgi:alpha-N-acetylglucosaminidase